jgi:hypothetical protein
MRKTQVIVKPVVGVKREMLRMTCSGSSLMLETWELLFHQQRTWLKKVWS